MTDPTPKAVVVPVEPTPEMIEAGESGYSEYHKPTDTYLDPQPHAIWSAMLAAAPQASLPPVEGVRVTVQNAVARSMAEDEQWLELSGPARAVLMLQVCRRVTEALAALSPVPSGGGEPQSGRWYAAEDIDRMVRDIDVAMNGDGAARQAKLCDIYPQIIKLAAPVPAVEAGWRSPSEIPDCKKGDCEYRIVAVRRRGGDTVYTFTAAYLNAMPLWFEDENDSRPVTGWNSDREGDDGPVFDPLLSEGDELMGWREFPAFAPSAPGEPLPDEGLRADTERMRAALGEAESVLSLVEHGKCADPDHQDEVSALGERIGFGALMSAAQYGWREALRRKGHPVGAEFVSGPCFLTVQATLKNIRAALGEV